MPSTSNHSTWKMPVNAVKAPATGLAKQAGGMMTSWHSPLVFRQPWSLFWRFSTLPHKEYEIAHVLVRALIIRTWRARSRGGARPQRRALNGCGKSRGRTRSLDTGGSVSVTCPCPLKTHAATHERAWRCFFLLWPDLCRYELYKTIPHHYADLFSASWCVVIINIRYERAVN